MNDNKIRTDSAKKNYDVEGETLSLLDAKRICSQFSHCVTTGVSLSMDESNPSSEPFRLSLNRIQGHDGPRTKPTKKYLHSKENVEASCRALNLAQRNFTTEMIVEWVNHIRSNPWGSLVDEEVDDIIGSDEEVLFDEEDYEEENIDDI